MSIWLTRPYDDSQHMADMLAERKIDSVIAPVMDIELLPTSWPDTAPDAILLTSRYGANTLASAPATWRNVPVYCAGPATAQAAMRHGYENIMSVETGVLEVLPLLREHHANQTVLYPSGEDIKLDVAPLLASDGITVERVMTYRAKAKTRLPAIVLDAFAEQEIQGIVFASPRAVQIACDLIKQHGLRAAAAKLDLYCLSMDIAAEAAKLLGGMNVYACALPSYDAMMELLTKHAMKTRNDR